MWSTGNCRDKIYTFNIICQFSNKMSKLISSYMFPFMRSCSNSSNLFHHTTTVNIPTNQSDCPVSGVYNSPNLNIPKKPFLRVKIPTFLKRKTNGSI